jgi:hypothetical protein
MGKITDWPPEVEDLIEVGPAERNLPEALKRIWTGFEVPITPMRVGVLAFLACPYVPEHHHQNAEEVGPDYWRNLGPYTWLDFEIAIPPRPSRQLRLAFHHGDLDCNDGCWGGVWDLYNGEEVASIESVGDCETGIGVSGWMTKVSFKVPESVNLDGEDPEIDKVPLSWGNQVFSGSGRVVLLAMRWAICLLR